eukprot:366341-Chlamydomonas_euryale.AAC.11
MDTTKNSGSQTGYECYVPLATKAGQQAVLKAASLAPPHNYDYDAGGSSPTHLATAPEISRKGNTCRDTAARGRQTRTKRGRSLLRAATLTTVPAG